MQQSVQEQVMDGAEVFFILKDRKLILAQRHPPESFYIKGMMENGRFIPKSTVLGIGDLAQDGRYGWLELHSKEFFPMESDRKAITPFVKGYMQQDNFVPSVREIYSEP